MRNQALTSFFLLTHTLLALGAALPPSAPLNDASLLDILSPYVSLLPEHHDTDLAERGTEDGPADLYAAILAQQAEIAAQLAGHGKEDSELEARGVDGIPEELYMLLPPISYEGKSLNKASINERDVDARAELEERGNPDIMPRAQKFVLDGMALCVASTDKHICTAVTWTYAPEKPAFLLFNSQCKIVAFDYSFRFVFGTHPDMLEPVNGAKPHLTVVAYEGKNMMSLYYGDGPQTKTRGFSGCFPKSIKNVPGNVFCIKRFAC